MEGKNEVDSVKETNLYKVLTYLSWKTAKQDYKVSVEEAIHSKN